MFNAIRRQFPRVTNRLKDFLFVEPFTPVWRKKLNGQLMVYLYHRIGDVGEHDFLDCGGSPLTSESEFREDLLMLKQMGAEFIRVKDIHRCDFQSSKFYVAITIDDGFASNYRAGLAIANELEIPLTLFQCSSMLEGQNMLWEHQLYWLFKSTYIDQFKRYIQKAKPQWPVDLGAIRDTCDPQEVGSVMIDFLSSDDIGSKNTISDKLSKDLGNLYPKSSEIKEAFDQGHEIASHGVAHYERRNIGHEVFEAELAVSKERLEEVTGVAPVSFSYPFNGYLGSDHEKVKQYYQYVATVDWGCVSDSTTTVIPRNTWPGTPKNSLRHRRWLLTGKV